MILYFSGTGNSKYCAEKIAKELNEQVCSINDMMKKNIQEIDAKKDSVLGFVCPTYDFDLSYAVAEFLETLHGLYVSKEAYVFALFTCGKSCGAAENTMRRILQDKGIPLHGAYKVEMPDNYIPMFPLISKEEQQNVLKEADICLDEIIHQIRGRKETTIITPQMPAPMRWIIKKVAVPNQRKATKNFWVTEECIGCGQCERICPKNIIHLKDGKPVWVKDDCACCLGCLHRCPKQAIQYGKKTVRRGRYTNPNVKL